MLIGSDHFLQGNANSLILSCCNVMFFGGLLCETSSQSVNLWNQFSLPLSKMTLNELHNQA